MTWSRAELEIHLAATEACIPHLRNDMNSFFRAFEDEVEVILCNAAEGDQDYALSQLDAMIERAGINAKPLAR